jgi:hypothetical protein
MWWFLPKFLSKSDNTLSSNFFPSVVYISMLQIQPDTASHTILTSTKYFVILPGFYVRNYKRPPTWDHGFIKWQFLLGAVKWPKFM